MSVIQTKKITYRPVNELFSRAATENRNFKIEAMDDEKVTVERVNAAFDALFDKYVKSSAPKVRQFLNSPYSSIFLLSDL